MKYINHIIDPDRLLLAWQSLDKDFRKRIAVAELISKENKIVLKYIENQEVEEAKTWGFVGFPSFKISKKEYNDNVLETFLRRLPPRSRSDFSKFLEGLHLPSNIKVSEFALLGYSEAKLPGDGFSLVHPFDNAKPPFELLADVSGFQYYEGPKMNLKNGDIVSLEVDRRNSLDSNAIQINIQGHKIGYINRLQRDSFQNWLERYEVRAEIERLNGTPEHPRAKIFVEIL